MTGDTWACMKVTVGHEDDTGYNREVAVRGHIILVAQLWNHRWVVCCSFWPASTVTGLCCIKTRVRLWSGQQQHRAKGSNGVGCRNESGSNGTSRDINAPINLCPRSPWSGGKVGDCYQAWYFSEAPLSNGEDFSCSRKKKGITTCCARCWSVAEIEGIRNQSWLGEGTKSSTDLFEATARHLLDIRVYYLIEAMFNSWTIL
jgi:hypothetical protein